jgi:hypothetical protein
MRIKPPESKCESAIKQIHSGILNGDSSKSIQLLKRLGLFCFAFVIVGLLAGLETLMTSTFFEAVILGGIFGLTAGLIVAIWGDRALNWLLKLF